MLNISPIFSLTLGIICLGAAALPGIPLWVAIFNLVTAAINIGSGAAKLLRKRE